MIGEDSDQGACSLCVDICPEIFEKPEHDGCARARADIDAAAYLDAIQRAVRECPTEVIRLVAAC